MEERVYISNYVIELQNCTIHSNCYNVLLTCLAQVLLLLLIFCEF